jgi:tetratricopeptide (TPR) repeat protein
MLNPLQLAVTQAQRDAVPVLLDTLRAIMFVVDGWSALGDKLGDVIDWLTLYDGQVHDSATRTIDFKKSLDKAGKGSNDLRADVFNDGADIRHTLYSMAETAETTSRDTAQALEDLEAALDDVRDAAYDATAAFGDQKFSAEELAGRIAELTSEYIETLAELEKLQAIKNPTADQQRDIIAKSKVCFAITARTAALSLAGVDLGRPMDVLRRLRRLPPDDPCRNQTYLASRPPIPSDPEQLDHLIEANAMLAVGFDGVEHHDFAQLRGSLDKLARSPARTDPGVAAGMMILRGWLAYDDKQIAETRKLFVDAYYAGRAIDDELISSVALILLIEYSSDMALPPATLKEWLRTALADADRVHTRSPWLAGRVYVVAAQAADLGGDAESALMFVARARTVLERGDPSWIETHAIEGAVQMWSGHVDDGVKAYELAIAQKTAYLGPDDPDVASLLSDYAASLLEVGRLPPALDAAARAAKIIDNLADPDDDRVDPVRVNLAAVLLAANQDVEARGLLETARANNVKRFGEANTIVANIDANLAMIYSAKGEDDRAIAALRSALAVDEKLIGADQVEIADIFYNLAATYRSKHDYLGAITAARRAAQIFGAKSPGSDRHRLALTMAAVAANDAGDFAQALALTQAALGFTQPAEAPQTLAWAQLERARALIGVHRAAEARPLLVAARARYAESHMTERVEQVEALLAHLPR